MIPPLDAVDLERVSRATNRAFIASIERSRARARGEGEVSADEMRRRVLGRP